MKKISMKQMVAVISIIFALLVCSQAARSAYASDYTKGNVACTVENIVLMDFFSFRWGVWENFSVTFSAIPDSTSYLTFKCSKDRDKYGNNTYSCNTGGPVAKKYFIEADAKEYENFTITITPGMQNAHYNACKQLDDKVRIRVKEYTHTSPDPCDNPRVWGEDFCKNR